MNTPAELSPVKRALLEKPRQEILPVLAQLVLDLRTDLWTAILRIGRFHRS
jgi:hypothetical protein